MSLSKNGGTFFASLTFYDLPFLSKLTQERVIYLLRKPWIVVNENSFEIGSKSFMTGSRGILVKLVLFQLDGRDHPKDGATPSFFPGSRGSMLGIAIEVELTSEFFWKGGENLKRVKRGANIYGGACKLKDQF